MCQFIQKVLLLICDRRALYALLSWPTYSLTSYFMVKDLVRQGIKPATVIDIGANIGQFAVASAKLFDALKIYSFEPLPQCSSDLQRHVSKLGNVKVFAVALGEQHGEAAFHINQHAHSSSILPLSQAHKDSFPEANEVGTVMVPLARLDEVLIESDIIRPSLLKLDVQGYEVNVLRGAEKLLPSIDFVILEASFKPLYEGERLFLEIVDIMADYGFEFRRPVGWLAEPKSGEILQMDALFVRKE